MKCTLTSSALYTWNIVKIPTICRTAKGTDEVTHFKLLIENKIIKTYFSVNGKTTEKEI